MKQGSQNMQWREVVWQTALPRQAAADALEQLAASPELGTIALELRAVADGARWLIGAVPAQLDAVSALVTDHLPARTHVPRRVRRAVEQTGRLRLTGAHLALSPDRVAAAVRGLFGALTRLEDREEVVVQLLLGRRHSGPLHREPSSRAWLDLVLGSPTAGPKGLNGSNTRHDGLHGFSANVRVGVSGATASKARHLAHQVLGALRVLETATSRLRLDQETPSYLDHARRPWRWPLTLSSAELVGLTGWPVGEPPLPLLGPAHPRQAVPQVPLVAMDRVFGHTAAAGHPSQPVGLPIRDAAFHTHLLGPTGSAKSTVMLSMITADMAAGRGVLVLDPKGDLATDVLARVPAARRDDVVVLDPTNVAPVGFNPLRGPARQEAVTADTLLSTFQSLFAQHWGIRSADILTAAFLTLARVPGANLLWLPPLLTDPAFRRRVLSQVVDPLGVGAFWDRYEAKRPDQQAEEIAPVLNKLRQLILRPGLRAVLGQSEPTFDVGELFTKCRIVIVNLNRGLLGADAARLLGTLLLGQLWSRILARQASPLTHRHIVGIYIDEVHDFLDGLPGDLSDAFAQARSLGASFTVANQYLAQLTPAMRQSLETNARSKIYFGLGGTDAATAARNAPGLEAQDFMLLPPFHAYAHLIQAGRPTGWFLTATHQAPPATGDGADLYAASHQRYGVPASQTEQAILDLINPVSANPEPLEDDAPIGRVRR
ncbi:type IV secretory system conjugative DNA transfer family protein [Cellulomonas sp. PS-H5]|uniref:type IV secretory system conjugative DNA transfer family protein n=1 Tax=Cellulomonas sp. PS-H5 TaxID=2820400 RepID=UPI001C4FF57C|nr:type IV secretion system DNA-binding domain-containing protein [Cellulomonas sp. PS-H5]MBW0252584.1 type IV secretion system DNA-binding domain-containing protein [Cellulomonas sp. PS-H5]